MENKMKIEYKLKFLSDWHIGSGTGIPGVVDNGTLKDRSNRAVINGKTVKGLTRDSLEDILGLLPYSEKECLALIEDIFGNKGNKEGKAIFYHPQIVPKESGRNTSSMSNFDDEEFGNIRFHTSIDQGTRTAKTGHLFSEEVFGRELKFKGQIRANKEHVKYIIAALRFITKIGGKRRRGLGQCEFEITSPETVDTYIEELFK